MHFAAETNPLQDNHLQHTKARFLRYKLQARRKSWRNKTASLNLEKDGTCTKLWRLTKQLNNEGNGRATTTLEADGQLLSRKQAVNKFADNYEEVSNIPVTKQHQREARREQRERKTHQISKCMHGQEAHIERATSRTQTAKGKEISSPRCNYK